MKGWMVVLVLGSAIGVANGKPKADAKPSAVTEPEPGKCAYIQPSVKVCSTISGQGAFDVFTFPPAQVYISFENDKIERVGVAPESIFKMSYGEDRLGLMIRPQTKDLPARTPIVITTQRGLTVTINLRPGSLEKADTQVAIHDPQQSQRDAVVQKALDDLNRTLEPKAQARAEAILLEELAESGADIKQVGGETTSRNRDGLVVFRAKHVFRIGKRRYLLLSVENLSGEPFTVRNIRLLLSDNPVQAAWKIGRNSIGPGEESAGAIAVPLVPRGKTIPARLVIEEADARRNGELKLEIP